MITLRVRLIREATTLRNDPSENKEVEVEAVIAYGSGGNHDVRRRAHAELDLALDAMEITE